MININKFLSNKDLSLNLAKYIVNQIKNKKNFILGCPSGRSLKNTYKFIGIISYRQNVDLSKSAREILFHADRLTFQYAGKLKAEIQKKHANYDGFKTKYKLDGRKKTKFIDWLDENNIEFSNDELEKDWDLTLDTNLKSPVFLGISILLSFWKM